MVPPCSVKGPHFFSANVCTFLNSRKAENNILKFTKIEKLHRVGNKPSRNKDG